jgi:hypothetical protein
VVPAIDGPSRKTQRKIAKREEDAMKLTTSDADAGADAGCSFAIL